MSVRRLAPAEQQPKEFSFTKENLDWAKAAIAKYPEGRQASAIIPILWRAQEQCGGWLPEVAIRNVADMLGMAHIRALEIATFYTQFILQPAGAENWRSTCGPGLTGLPLAKPSRTRSKFSGVRSSYVSFPISTIGAFTQAPRHSTSSQEKSPSAETWCGS